MKTWLKVMVIASTTGALSLGALSAVGAVPQNLKDVVVVAAGGTNGNGPALDGLKDVVVGTAR